MLRLHTPPPDAYSPGLRAQIRALLPRLLRLPQNHSYIPRLSMHITTYIHYDFASKFNELVDEFFTTPFTRWVNDESSIVPWEILNYGEDFCRVALEERAFLLGDIVQRSIALCKPDGFSGEFNSSDVLEVGRKGDRKESASTISVHQVSWAG